MDTRRSTNRQVTWFRNQMRNWEAITAQAARDALIRQAKN
jgi:tRNA A37 N6-isopentenylltransferase MiaA